MTDELLTTMVAMLAGSLGLAVFVLVRSLLDRRRIKMEERLLTRTDSTDSIMLVDLPEENHAYKGVSTRMDEVFEKLVHNSGLMLTPAQVLGIIGMAAVGLAAVLYLWRGELWLSMVGLVFGITLPLWVLRSMQGRQRIQMQQQLPDALFFLSRSLRAGLSFEQALQLVAEESAPPLCEELKRCSEQIKLGLNVPVALQNAARRIDLPDFHVFVSVVALHRSTGGNLALLLDRLANSTRDRNQYSGHFRSATALGRTSAIAIGAAVPLIFLGYAIFEPDYALRFFQSGSGMAMLAIAFTLEVIGLVWLYVLLKVQY
jgi:tight adherence protein B